MVKSNTNQGKEMNNAATNNETIEKISDASGPDLSTREATELIREFYELETPNPGEPPAKATRIYIDVEEDEEGDYYWLGTIHDQDGTSVEFSMADHYPESYRFEYF